MSIGGGAASESPLEQSLRFVQFRFPCTAKAQVYEGVRVVRFYPDSFGEMGFCCPGISCVQHTYAKIIMSDPIIVSGRQSMFKEANVIAPTARLDEGKSGENKQGNCSERNYESLKSRPAGNEFGGRPHERDKKANTWNIRVSVCH